MQRRLTGLIAADVAVKRAEDRADGRRASAISNPMPNARGRAQSSRMLGSRGLRTTSFCRFTLKGHSLHTANLESEQYRPDCAVAAAGAAHSQRAAAQNQGNAPSARRARAPAHSACELRLADCAGPQQEDRLARGPRRPRPGRRRRVLEVPTACPRLPRCFRRIACTTGRSSLPVREEHLVLQAFGALSSVEDAADFLCIGPAVRRVPKQPSDRMSAGLGSACGAQGAKALGPGRRAPQRRGRGSYRPV